MAHKENRHYGSGVWARCIVPLLMVIAVLAIGCSKDDSSELTPSPEPSVEDQSALKEQLDEIASEVAELRGLSPKTEVKYEFITSDDLRTVLLDMAEDELPIEEMQIDQEVFVLLDLLEEGQDLRSILLDLYSEQIMGFYDDQTKELFVVSDKTELGPMEEITFVHEYTHALQDQCFDLTAFLPEDSHNADLDLARVSLAEGDATAVEASYILSTFDISEVQELLEMMESTEMEKFEAAPRVLQENLLFPYEAGFEFAMSFESHNELNNAYRDPPQSTEQILHSDRYWDLDEPQSIDLSPLSDALKPNWTEFDRDVLGELNTRIYLETFVDAGVANEAAGGWDGDQYIYLKDSEGRKLLVLSFVWDSAKDADEFFKAYIDFAEEKSDGDWNLRLSDSAASWWESEGQSLYVGQSDDRTLLIIAPDGGSVEKVLSEFLEFAAL